ncbi:protein DBF4 homolog B [Hemicordylus capensis]|uniref:protein DBF4 homolog B n=1 Tax=Hemicordylus capensis TaxID=884348 RepID=UPI002303C76A|nr:protein DBF4 homolog B [Hemicordylus capensis]XP_053115290.1 protein DBF4 homolog B [Hemicordylus capensis]XP_053115291.1 protein DBF4 homolog B [Hemicordylus capensis]XP_053115292.1 protein DBF4 homolog B [Hemicordylus capensis]XP_053115293.1 protein DBF4 homolog B [Hemicordylus capensis]XP_053115295.1 protein DBF4 homolog B [Hemicordylus capensis]
MADWELCQWQSLARVDCQDLNSQLKPTREQWKAASSVRSRPLAGKSFYLDLPPSNKNLRFLAESVKQLGGVVESFLSKEVTYVVSSSQEAKQKKWAEKQNSAVSRDTQVGTWPSAGPGSGCRGPERRSTDTVLISRGKEFLRKAIGSQGSTCGNSILANARSWGVQIMHTDDMLSCIRRLESKKHFSKVKLLASGLQSLKVVRLKPPFLKIEDESRQHRPFLQQFESFPELCFRSQRRHSPFEAPQAAASSKKWRASKGQQSPSELSPHSLCCVRPKTQKGYCECCKEAFIDLHTHLQDSQHKEFALDPSHYALVDHIISQLTNDFEVFSCSSPQRASLDTYDGDPFGFQVADAEGATVSPSGQAEECCVFAEVEQPVSPEGLTHLLEDQGQLTKPPLKMLKPPMPLVLHSLELPSDQTTANDNREPDKGGREAANASPEAMASTGEEHGAATQQKRLLAQPSVLPRKRKLSASYGQAKRRKILLEEPPDERLVDKNLLPGGQDVGTAAGCPFPPLSDKQTVPGHLGLPTVPFCTPSPPCAFPQLPEEGLPCRPSKLVAVGISSSQIPVQHLDQSEVFAVCPCEKQDTHSPCNFLSPNTELREMSGLPVDKHLTPKLPGSMDQRCSPCMNISELTQDVLLQQPGLGPSPGLPRPRCPRTNPPTEAKSSSSESEWDGPLLCVLADASRLQFQCPVDAALLGASVSMQDSSYDSHLCSVLWQTPEPNWAHKENPDCWNSRTEMERPPFSAVGACLENWAS